MSSYQIVCVDKACIGSHEHIVSVGTGVRDQAAAKWTVEEMRTGADDGTLHFFTVSPMSGRAAEVEPWVCSCGLKTIRSQAHDNADNNVDNLRSCTWRKPSKRLGLSV